MFENPMSKSSFCGYLFQIARPMTEMCKSVSSVKWQPTPWKHLNGHSNTLCGQMTQYIHIRGANCSYSPRLQNPGVNLEVSTFHQPTPLSLNHLLDPTNGTTTTIQSSNQYRTTATKFFSAVGKPKVGATGYSDKPTARDIAQDHIPTSVKELSRPHTIMSVPPQLCQAQGG